MATNSPSNIATGASGTVLTGNGVGVTPTFQAAAGGSDPFSDIAHFAAVNEQFMGGGPAFAENWSNANFNSGGSGAYATPVVGHPGIGQVSTNANTAGGACYRLGNNTLYTTGGAITVDYLATISNLSDGTDTFAVEFGLSNVAAANSTITDGVWWRYTSTENSGNWTIKTATASSVTTANTSTAADTNWHVFRFIVNSTATSVAFYYDGVQVANSPISTNIPGGSGTAIQPFFRILKSAGTNNRLLLIDAFYFQQAF